MPPLSPPLYPPADWRAFARPANAGNGDRRTLAAIGGLAETLGGVRLKFHAPEVMFHAVGRDQFTKGYEMQYLKRHRRIDPINPCNYKDFTMMRFRDFMFGNGLATDVKHVGKPATVWPRNGEGAR